MGQLVTIKELSEQTGFKASKIRRWTKKGILTPVSKSEDDGKSYLYHIDCVRIKTDIVKRIIIDFSLEAIGARFLKVFGSRNSILIDELQQTQNHSDLVRKYTQMVRTLEL